MTPFRTPLSASGSSKIVSCVAGAAAGPSHRTRVSPPSALVTSPLGRPVYVAVKEPGVAPAVSVPRVGARRVRRTVRELLAVLTNRCSTYARSIALPSALNAVPLTTTVPADGFVALLTVTLATVVSSAACVSRSVIRTTSPGRMFGVWVVAVQQPPPGWLTSARPEASTDDRVGLAHQRAVAQNAEGHVAARGVPVGGDEVTRREGDQRVRGHRRGHAGRGRQRGGGRRHGGCGAGAPWSGAVHGAAGPAMTSVPFS